MIFVQEEEDEEEEAEGEEGEGGGGEGERGGGHILITTMMLMITIIILWSFLSSISIQRNKKNRTMYYTVIMFTILSLNKNKYIETLHYKTKIRWTKQKGIASYLTCQSKL